MERSCPGSDGRRWTPEDIYEVGCPGCGRLIEFFRDDMVRVCDGCGRRLENPRRVHDCAEHCPAAARCLSARAGRQGAAE